MQWTRGNLSFIFNGDEARTDSLSMVVLDNDSKEYQKMKLIGSVRYVDAYCVCMCARACMHVCMCVHACRSQALYSDRFVFFQIHLQ